MKKNAVTLLGMALLNIIFIFSGCIQNSFGPTPTPTPTPIPIPKIDSISPQSGTSGTKITITGSGFGNSQGSSLLIMKRGDDKTFEAEIITWSDISIYARVPQLMKDRYRVYVLVSGNQSNEVEFKLETSSLGSSFSSCFR